MFRLDQFKRVERPDDPERCQAITANGQCLIKSLPNSNYCAVHGGNRVRPAQIAKYRAEKWRASIEHHVAGTNWQSITEEIGILRMLLEEHLCACRSSTDLILQAGPISDLVVKIEKLVSSCAKLELQLNLHLSKDQLIEVANRIVEVAANYVSPDQFQAFGEDVGNLITEK